MFLSSELLCNRPQRLFETALDFEPLRTLEVVPLLVDGLVLL